MPTIHVDTETAALMEAAFAMLEAALTARVSRADPDQVISSSLRLQAIKLATARAHLKMPEPPPLSMNPQSVQNAVLGTAQALLDATTVDEADAAFDRLRRFVYAADVRPPTEAGHPPVQALAPGDPA